MEDRICIRNIPEISAVYYALLQCGYDWYTAGKDAGLVRAVEQFRAPQSVCAASFFSQTRQTTCEVYPYWPRASMLEAAVFFTDPVSARFDGFDILRNRIMSAGNISDEERGPDLWKWLEGFPPALNRVLNSDGFQAYLSWENQWIKEQNAVWKTELIKLERILDFCASHYASPIQNVSAVLNPIKCAYSADYHISGNRFFFCSGAFQPENLIHEFLHPIVHPLVAEAKDAVRRARRRYPGIDDSYYLSGDDGGQANAFEEYLVRCLCDALWADDPPADMRAFLYHLLERLP